MLLNRPTLDRIRRGTQRLVFRTWRKPTVKAGGTLATGIGQLGILSVEKIDVHEIRETDAEEAGYPNFTSLLRDLESREGQLYRIEVEWLGEDPRITLRNAETLADGDFDAIRTKLEGFDRRSAVGPWTRGVLDGIARNPGLRAGDLADLLGLEKEWLKTNVRKLKNLGLTESLSPGYRLSPRGGTFLRRINEIGLSDHSNFDPFP